MAMHLTLPIYKASKRLLTVVLDVPKDMRKDAKFLIGKELLTEALAIMRLVRKANMAFDKAKVPHIDEILEKLQYIEDLVVAAHDATLLSDAKLARVQVCTQDVGKQANGWKKHYE